jgi:hypothetical protein
MSTLCPVSGDTLGASAAMNQFVLAERAFIMLNQPLFTRLKAIFFHAAIYTNIFHIIYLTQ